MQKNNEHDPSPDTHNESQHIDQTSYFDVQGFLNRLSTLSDPSLLVKRERSPQLRVSINNFLTDVTIDEGSELNCVSDSLVSRLKLKYIPMKSSAVAAGQSSIQILGVLAMPLMITVLDVSIPTSIKLDGAVIVKNLGQNILVGEPGKKSNKIFTNPSKKTISLRNGKGKRISIPYFSRQGKPLVNSILLRAAGSQIIYPNETITLSLPSSVQSSYLSISARGNYSSFSPIIDHFGSDIIMKNDSTKIMTVKQNDHLFDVTACHVLDMKDETSEIDKIRKIYDIGSDMSQFYPTPGVIANDRSYLEDISIDPDNIMPQIWKNRFKQLCEDFTDIITPIPGKYNGAFGHVSTAINFTSPPPSNLKTYMPKYSYNMMKILAEKMDSLESWGVLQKPENLGVIPEFVVPSMLTPKPDSNEYRLVTDFTSLNKFIKKLPTISPNVQQAKTTIAKFKYHVFLDLSNYYYQGGVSVFDSQYLATVHPFKGLMIYTVEPQGLLNSGEHAYERLGRIFGDLCANQRMTRMADGLYVLGNTYSELWENLKEVFERAKIANLTFKPKKIMICPQDTVLFGWRKKGDAWVPTEHTTTPLVNATLPKTVKQLRSWLGSYKQLAACIKGYAVPIGNLEKLTGSTNKSASKINWTKQLEDDFNNAKRMIGHIQEIYVPKPNDQLETYSDYSEEHKAIGGRMLIKRKTPEGIITLNGGYFSVRLSDLQSKWLPCEGEALGIKLVLEHFSPYLRENENVVTHYTDSLPCVQAFRRSRLGAFSNSARIATYLTSISSLNIEIVHMPGKKLSLVDNIGRNPTRCSETKCQICKFVHEQIEMGEKASNIMNISAQDVIDGKVAIPFTQTESWLNAQKKDDTHRKLTNLIRTSQAPIKKKTGNDNTKLKLLHNLYKEGKLKIMKNGLIIIKHKNEDGSTSNATSIPTVMFPGLIHALHRKLSHPSKLQLSKLVARHFYTPGYLRIIEEVTNACELCAAVKTLPKETFTQSTGKMEGFGANLSADVIERNGQQILIVREKLSSYTIHMGNIHPRSNSEHTKGSTDTNDSRRYTNVRNNHSSRLRNRMV